MESTNPYPQEKEGQRILQGHKPSAILLLLRFWPYPDKTLFLFFFLRERTIPDLESLLIARIDDRHSVGGLSKDQMLHRLKPSLPADSLTSLLHSKLHPTVNDLEAVIRQFHQISFEDLVQYTLGYASVVSSIFHSLGPVLTLPTGRFC